MQYYDQETGKHYNYFRDYDPATGRYIQSDPIGVLGGINTYSYVKGNPTAYSDERGLLATWDHHAITYNSAKKHGASDAQATALALAVVNVDKGTQTSRPEHTLHHAMVGDGQKAAQAAKALADFLNNPNASLADKIHASQDAAAPWHYGQKWDPIAHPWDAAEHLLKDAFPGEGVLEVL